VISIRGHSYIFADACGARPLIKSGIEIRVRGAIGPREADDNVMLGEIEGAQLSAPSHAMSDMILGYLVSLGIIGAGAGTIWTASVLSAW
jgi:hypothetical protein